MEDHPVENQKPQPQSQSSQNDPTRNQDGKIEQQNHDHSLTNGDKPVAQHEESHVNANDTAAQYDKEIKNAELNPLQKKEENTDPNKNLTTDQNEFPENDGNEQKDVNPQNDKSDFQLKEDHTAGNDELKNEDHPQKESNVHNQEELEKEEKIVNSVDNPEKRESELLQNDAKESAQNEQKPIAEVKGHENNAENDQDGNNRNQLPEQTESHEKISLSEKIPQEAEASKEKKVDSTIFEHTDPRYQTKDRKDDNQKAAAHHNENEGQDFDNYDIQVDEQVTDRQKENAGVVDKNHDNDDEDDEFGQDYNSNSIMNYGVIDDAQGSSKRDQTNPDNTNPHEFIIDSYTSDALNEKLQDEDRKYNAQGHKLKPHDRREIEENIRRHQLEEVVRQKKELEKKLKVLEFQIRDLSHSPDLLPKTTAVKSKKVAATKEEEEAARVKAESLIRRMNAERKRKEERELLRIENYERQVRKEIEHIYERQAKKLPKVANKNARDIFKKIDERDRDMEGREARLYGGSVSVKHMPLYKQMEQYGQEIQMHEFEQRKKLLAERRQLYRPFQEGELDRYGQKYEGNKKFYELEKKKEVIEDNKARIMANNNKKFSSKFTKKVIEYDEQIRSLDMQKANQRKALVERMQQYSKAVKDVYLPQIHRDDDLLLPKNIKSVIEKAEALGSYDNYWAGKKKYPMKIRMSPRIGRKIRDEEIGAEHHRSRDYANESKGSSLERSPDSEPPIRSSMAGSLVSKSQRLVPSKAGVAHSRSTDKAGPFSPSHLENQSTQQDEPVEPKKVYPNYIEELKKQRMEMEKKGLKYKKQTWEKHLQDDKLSYYEKVNFVLDDLKAMEEKAKEKENWLRENKKLGSKYSKEEEEEVDDLYAEAIRAKIAVLAGSK